MNTAHTEYSCHGFMLSYYANIHFCVNTNGKSRLQVLTEEDMGLYRINKTLEQ